jgi:hypothetical protein
MVTAATRPSLTVCCQATALSNYTHRLTEYPIMGERPALPSRSERHQARSTSRLVLIVGAVVAIALVTGGVVTAGRDGDRAPAAGPAPAAQLAAAPLAADRAVTGARTAPLSPGELALQL